MSKTLYNRIQANGRRYPLARYMMQQYLERELTDDEIVHHINGNSLDDRFENFEIMTREEHNRYHLSGEKNPNYGKYLADETRSKISEAKRGMVFSEEHKRKLSEAKRGNKNRLGKKHTLETKQKISESLNSYHTRRRRSND